MTYYEFITKRLYNYNMNTDGYKIQYYIEDIKADQTFPKDGSYGDIIEHFKMLGVQSHVFDMFYKTFDIFSHAEEIQNLQGKDYDWNDHNENDSICYIRESGFEHTEATNIDITLNTIALNLAVIADRLETAILLAQKHLEKKEDAENE